MQDQDLIALVGRMAPRRLLLLGPCARALVADYLASEPVCELTELPHVASVPAGYGWPHFDLGVVCGVLEQLNERVAGALIAKLRDVWCQRLLVVAPIGEGWSEHRSAWQQTDLLGYGFTLLSSQQQDGRVVQVYGFDLATYKTTPDWLNARYWAHPELFGKYWW